MAVSFNRIPVAGQLRTPLFFIEFDNSKAGSPSLAARPALLIGHRTSAGTVAELTLTRIDSASQAKTAFGEGSNLWEMVDAYRDNDAFGELWGCAIDEEAGGTAGTQTLTFAGTATAAGKISLYVNGQLVEATVASGDAHTDVSVAVDAALTAADDLPVTNGEAAGVVTLTARHKGSIGNDVDVRANYLGSVGGEVLPAGITLAIAAGVTGATDPALSTLAATLGDEEFDYIGHPWAATTQLNVFETLLDDVTGRWAFNRQIFGHGFCSQIDTVANLGTFGNGRNDPHNTVFGIDAPAAAPWQCTGAAVAQIKRSIDADPARPMQSLKLIGIKAAAKSARFTGAQRNTLLFDGIATLYADRAGAVRVERVITTYQTDAYGNADDSYLDLNTLATAAAMSRGLKAKIEGDFPRHKLVDDDTPFEAGQAITTPKIVRNALISAYREFVRLGWAENIDLFADNLIVERPAGDPNRLDVIFPPDFANQFRVLGMVMQPRLQYPATA